MRNAITSFLLAGLMVAGSMVVTGCSGGSSNSSSSVRIRCLGGQSFCIISCDLGCSQTGCSVTEIAENQRMRFKFSDAVDPDSVNGASISIRTATGIAPDGDFLVSQNEVTFVPNVRTVSGISTFGFLRNESYIISLAGGNTANQSVTNLAGDPLSTEFTCTVVASLGILDEDQQPPMVELLSPTNLTAAPTNPTIVLRFSELIDTTPLQVSLGEASPIRVVLRGTLPSGLCDSDAEGIALEGVPQLSTETIGSREVTVVTFQPAVQLPGESCITVRVTADLRDLSGRSAVPAKFVFLTVPGVSTPIEITEGFASDAGQETLVSGGVWGGPQGPGARPGLVGGDGRHGSFDPTLGPTSGGGVFVWNTDSFTIPMSSSLTGLEYLVTDGRFFFTDFVIPEGTTIRFTGTVPPVISVRGQVDIRGGIEVNGEGLPFGTPASGPAQGQNVSIFNARSAPGGLGQAGTAGGVGGGRGGNGANECLNNGPIIVGGIFLTDGQPGETVQLLAGHAYAASTGGTGGLGGSLVPASGMSPNLPNTQLISNIYLPHFSSGGSGGGFMLPGGAPATPTIGGTVPLIVEPAAAPSAAFPLLPYPAAPPPNYSSLNHYVVGGSGGGGGGSHGFGLFGFSSASERFMAGHAGTGGGGAVAIRAGGDVTIGAQALLESKGGEGVLINGDDPLTTTVNINNGISSPGGGGSGGSFLIQSGQDVSVAGSIDTSGGVGSNVGLISTLQLQAAAQAGSGSNGYYRLEAAGNVAFGGTSVPSYNPANNSGPLNDRDDLSGDTSTWRTTALVFPPTWDRYELDVDLDGDGTIDETYTDSGAAGTQQAYELGGPTTLPLIILFQGANLNQAGTEPIPGSVGPWREGIGGGAGPGINLDSVTGFRFTMTYNRALFPNMVVRELRVFAQS